MFEKIIRGIGRRLLNYGCENNQSAKTLDYRWTDPQNEKEAIIFLAKRLQFSAERCKAKKIALIGSDLLMAGQVEKLIPNRYEIFKFNDFDDFANEYLILGSEFVIGISSLLAHEIHTIADRLVEHKLISLIPFEYAVIPKIENDFIDRMWENSKDFISPLHVEEVDWKALFIESCEIFEPKTGIRDFVDLLQVLRYLQTRELSGNIAEFGSFKGQSGYLIARFLNEIKSKKKLFMFDMFESFPIESMGVDQFWSETHEVNFPDIKEKFKNLDNVTLIKGDFMQTFESAECGELALVFVDCDSFRGTKYLIDNIFENRLVQGGIMVFEDYGHANLLGNRLAVHQGFDNKKNAFCFFSQFSGSYFVCKTM